MHFEPAEGLIGLHLAETAEDRSGEVIVKGGPNAKKLSRRDIESLRKAKVKSVVIDPNDIEGAFLTDDVVNTETGEVIAEANTELTSREWQQIIESGVGTADIFFPERDDVRSRDQPDPQEGLSQDSARCDTRNLSEDASGRSADHSDRLEPVPRNVLRRRVNSISRELVV